jgi:hypothetical protein
LPKMRETLAFETDGDSVLLVNYMYLFATVRRTSKFVDLVKLIGRLNTTWNKKKASRSDIVLN